MKIKIWYIFFIPLLGCSHPESSSLPESLQDIENVTVYSPEAKPLFDANIVQEASFGEADGVFLGPIVRNIAVDKDGGVYIADYVAKTIHVYNANGSYVGSLGREGRGPGEFQMIWEIRISENHLHVLDYQLQKISVFDIDNLQHEQDINISLNEKMDNKPLWLNRTNQQGLFYTGTNFYIRSDGNYLIIFSDEGVSSADNIENRTYEISMFSPMERKYLEHEVFSFDWGGRVLVNEGLIMFNMPYKRGTHFDYSNGKLVYGWSEEMLFKFYDENGVYRNAIFYSYPKVELTKNDVLILYNDEDTKNAIGTDTLPTTWPAFKDLKLDDESRLWISTFTDDPEVNEWWVLEETGELITKFEWPHNEPIEVVKNGYIYTFQTEEESGLRQVVRYRFEMGS